jgi:hypothetical protein
MVLTEGSKVFIGIFTGILVGWRYFHSRGTFSHPSPSTHGETTTLPLPSLTSSLSLKRNVEHGAPRTTKENDGKQTTNSVPTTVTMQDSPSSIVPVSPEEKYVNYLLEAYTINAGTDYSAIPDKNGTQINEDNLEDTLNQLKERINQRIQSNKLE